MTKNLQVFFISQTTYYIKKMAKAVKAKKEKSIEETLWDSANKLRGTVESSEYKHVVLGLIFLKYNLLLNIFNFYKRIFYFTC